MEVLDMAIFKKNVLFKLFYPILFLSLLTFSCSTDNSITGDSNQTNLSKPNDITDYFSDDDEWYEIGFGFEIKKGSEADCAYEALLAQSESLPLSQIDNQQENYQKQTGYDFRDNFLAKSKKGNNYIASYYILSKYGIENNLIMKHSMEHLSLMNTGIAVSRELQHGTNDNQILINRSTYDDLKDLVTIYRDSENHKDIDVVLDYLENDLEKYYNKTISVVVADFE